MSSQLWALPDQNVSAIMDASGGWMNEKCMGDSCLINKKLVNDCISGLPRPPK